MTRSQNDDSRSGAEADESIDKARRALQYTRQQQVTGRALADRLATIRQANHFQEFWNEGLRGG